jgi:hypothetical protein
MCYTITPPEGGDVMDLSAIISVGICAIVIAVALMGFWPDKW